MKYGIITAGQSNTDGRVLLANAPTWLNQTTKQVAGVNMWNDTAGAFQTFELGANDGSLVANSTEWGYDMVFYYLLRQFLGEDVYAVKRSAGGTPISPLASSSRGYWSTDFNAIPQGQEHLLATLEQRILNAKAAAPDLTFRAFLWHQGESDYLPAQAVTDYYQNFKDVIAYVRRVAKNNTLPVIFGTVPENGSQFNQTIKDAHLQIAAEDPNAYVIDVGVATLRDIDHFDAASSEQLGTDMFNVIQSIMPIKVGVNVYVNGTKHNTTTQPDIQTGYDVSNIVAEGETFALQFSNVYDDGGESPLSPIQNITLGSGVAPVGNAESYNVDQDTVLTVAAPGVLANDTDADSATLTAELVTAPANGVLTLNADGSFTYTPTAAYVGSDSFVYRAFDSANYSADTTVSLTVDAVVTGQYLLDAYPDSVGLFYDYHRLSSTYSAPVVSIRRGSDNLVADFALVGDYVDKAAITTHLNGANGFVTKRWNQNGSAIHWEQADTAKQPQIAINGVLNEDVDGKLFDSHGSFTKLAALGTNNLFSLNSTVFITLNNTRSSALLISDTATSFWYGRMNQGSTGTTVGSLDAGSTPSVYADGVQISPINLGTLYNGISTGTKKLASITNIDLKRWTGISNAFYYDTLFSSEKIYGMIIYSTDKSADRISIEAILNNL